MCAVVFFSYYSSGGLGASTDLVVMEFAVILPLIGFIWMLYQRRNQALDMLSEMKCALLAILRAHDALSEGDLGGSNVESHYRMLCRAYEDITDSMHCYFLPSRFYSSRYPYIGYKSAMVRRCPDALMCG